MPLKSVSEVRLSAGVARRLRPQWRHSARRLSDCRTVRRYADHHQANCDRLIEQSFDIGGGKPVQVLTPATILNPPDAESVTILKLHGDISFPGCCILSRNQYEAAYGNGAIDLARPVPQALDHYFRNSSLLFLGCSLNQDRTVQVFEAIMTRAREEAADLVSGRRVRFHRRYPAHVAQRIAFPPVIRAQRLAAPKDP
jgi:hypothetical protein